MSRAAFVLEDDESSAYTGVYVELPAEACRRALPLSYTPDSGSYLVALFDEAGRDYIGQNDRAAVEELKARPGYTEISSMDRTAAAARFPEISPVRLNFVLDQLEILTRFGQ